MCYLAPFDTEICTTYDAADNPRQLHAGFVGGKAKVGSFGEHLRRQREMRGISLDEIVATTKIGRRLLTALEDEQFDLLPGGIFNKAYVRAYAKCVGMDEEAAVAEYLQAAQEAPPDTRMIAQQHASIHAGRSSGRAGFPLAPVLILIAVAAAGIGGWKLYQDHQNERQKRATAAAPANDVTALSPTASSAPGSVGGGNSQASAPQHDAAPSPASNASPQASTSAAKPAVSAPAIVARSTAPQASATPASAGGFEVVVRPKSTAWVSVKADGQVVVRGIIKPPDVKTIRATDQVVFFTGNAGAVEVTFNGKNVPVPGGVNEEQTLVFDSRGVAPRAQATTGTE